MLLLKSDYTLVKFRPVLDGRSNTHDPFLVGLLLSRYGTSDRFLLILRMPALLLDCA